MARNGFCLGVLFVLVYYGKAQGGVRGICERCNNINSAMTGYDVSGMSLVDPPLHNPAVKGIIFDVDSDTKWIDTYKEISCMGSFEQIKWSNFSEYLFGASQSHSEEYNFQLGEESTIGTNAKANASFSTKVPPPFSAGHGSNESASHMEQHYKKGEGSVSHAEARCNIYTITIYPENPDVKFTDNFINRIRQIDLAETMTEKDFYMRAFIREFGTHFGKKSTMGVGLKFETRFTQKETKDHSENTLNWCNSVNGARLFGIQLEDDTVDCNAPSLTVTTGTVNGVNRFSSSSYGSYPHAKLSEWQDSIEASDAQGTLDPLPLTQEYDLIMNLFTTPAVESIKHSDGTPINTTRLLETAIDGYSKYCHLLDGMPCKIIGCAHSVRLGDKVFNYALTDEQNRAIFEEWNTSPSKNQLFFKDNHWFISEGPWQMEDPELKSASCSLKDTTFINPIIDFETQTSTWKSCSMQCFKRELCKYWEFKLAEEHCIMIKDFDFMLETSEETFIGTRDCPGAKQLRNSVFGACVENHPSMWVPRGEQFFEKTLKVEKNDPTTVVIAGGYKAGTFGGQNIASVEVIGNYDCSWPVPKLPTPNRDHIMAITPEGTIISCGGDQDYLHCRSYDASLKAWILHSTLGEGDTHGREASSALTLWSGVYILGGFLQGTTSVFLPRGSNTWIEGPHLPVKVIESCAVPLGDSRFVILGGGHMGNLGRWEVFSHSVMYDTIGDQWTQRPNLKEARRAHGCAQLGNKIIVAGGIGSGDHGLSSTELIDAETGVVRYGGKLTTVRKHFSMARIGGRYQKVLAFGGNTGGIIEHDLASIEEWNDEDEKWALSPLELKVSRRQFSVVAVPPARLCEN